MVKLEVAFNDDQSAIYGLQVTLLGGRKISLTPLNPCFDILFTEAGKAIDLAKRVDELVKTTDWTKPFSTKV